MKLYKFLKFKKSMKRSDLKVGRIVRVIRNSNSNNYELNEKYRIVSIHGESVSACTLDGRWHGNHLLISDCQLVSLCREDIETEIKKLRSDIQNLQSKLDWLNETGNSEFDENEWKAWEAISIFDSKDLSKSERAKLIANLIRG